MPLTIFVVVESLLQATGSISSKRLFSVLSAAQGETYETKNTTTHIYAADLLVQRAVVRASQGTSAGLSRSSHSELLQMVCARVESEL